jgi:histidinol-phosphatase (PHP family)
MGDYHVHLHPHVPDRTGDPTPGDFSRELIERYVETATAGGLTEVCFTEHLYRMEEAGPVLGDFWEGEPSEVAAPTAKFVQAERQFSLESYVTAVVEAREFGLPVLLGMEIDFFPQTIEEVLDLLAPYPWDLLLGSVHWIGGFAIDVDDAAFEFDRRGVARVYEEYFELESALAGSGRVDVLAHVDVVKNHGHRLPEEPVDLYESVASAASSSGTAVEVSSAGLFEPCAELYPAPAFLEVLHDHGVGITLASDAHRPQAVGRRFDHVREAARQAGYTHRLEFRRRQGTSVAL